jgi:hypothetical protein
MGAIEDVKLVGIEELAREVLAECGGDINKATDAIVRQAVADRSVLRLLAFAAVRSVASFNVRSKRSQIWTAPHYDPGGNGHRVRALAAGNAAMLLDFPLMDRTPLRDASKEKVRENAETYYKQADDMNWKSRWLALIAARIPDGKSVGECLDEAALCELRDKAKHAKR